jgi:ribosomal protein L11 methyltransferase
VKWLEVSLTLDGELAEAVADLLARHAPGGVVIETSRIEDDPGEGHAAGPVIVRAFLPADDALADRQQSLEQGLWHLGQIQALPVPVYQPVEEADWSETWKAHYRAIPIGRRLIILPAWLPQPPGGRLPLILDPGMAFGTGTHPTTQLVLATLEDHLQAGQVVADLGCGSGILSIAAARLGMSRVLAVDIDPQAVEIARQNVERNGLSDRIRVEPGSLEILEQAIQASGLGFDLIVANILAPVLEEMLEQGLPRLVEPGGLIVLSGILDYQAASLAERAAAHGLPLLETRAQADWRALVLKRKPPPG